MCIKNIVRNKNRNETIRIRDYGISCDNRMYTKPNIMYCRVHGFQNKTFCKDCQNYE